MGTQVEAYDGVYAARNEAVEARICDGELIVKTRDGRTVHVPLNWFPWLEQATPEQQADFKVWGSDIHWNQLDDGISMQVVLLGRYKS